LRSLLYDYQELTFGFNKAKAIRDQKKLVKNMVELAKRIEGLETRRLERDIFKHIPELSNVYLNAQEYQDARWSAYSTVKLPPIPDESCH
jgi:hypothetical protein